MSPEDTGLTTAAGMSCCGSSREQCQERAEHLRQQMKCHTAARPASCKRSRKSLIKLIRSKCFSKFNKPSILLVRLRQNRENSNVRSLYFICLVPSLGVFLFKIKVHKK